MSQEELEKKNKMIAFSSIIIITAFGEYRYEALGTRLYLLDFINKVLMIARQK